MSQRLENFPDRFRGNVIKYIFTCDLRKYTMTNYFIYFIGLRNLKSFYSY